MDTNQAVRMVQDFLFSTNDRVNNFKDILVQFMNENWIKVKDLHTIIFRVIEYYNKLVEAIDKHPLVQWFYGVLETVSNENISRAVAFWK